MASNSPTTKLHEGILGVLRPPKLSGCLRDQRTPARGCNTAEHTQATAPNALAVRIAKTEPRKLEIASKTRLPNTPPPKAKAKPV
eukprot:10195763-Alexandrium_andersonii.AAC.1